MALRIDVHLLDSAYQASTLDRSRAEWPPHPYRLFCAMVSVADADDPVQDAALTWLEEQPAPVVMVPVGSLESVEPRQAWVPVNATERTKPGHAVLPGRTNGGKPKTWPQRTLAEAQISFIWPQDPAPGVGAILQLLATRVAYFGRAGGHALVTARLTDDDPSLAGGTWQQWLPADPRAHNAEFLRAPYPGFLKALRTAHAQGQRAFQSARPHPYQQAGTEPQALKETTVDGPYADLLTFAFPSEFSLDPCYALSVTSSLRAKVSGMLNNAGHDVDAMVAVHGHKQPGDQRQVCAFMAMPFVGHRHADGRLRGVGIALPRDLDPAHRKALLAILLRLGGGLRKLEVPTLHRPLPLRYVSAGDPSTKMLQTVRSERWTAASAEWSTALPMVLDFFPKRNGKDIEASVAASCIVAGLPEPVSVEVLHRGAFLPGAPTLPPYALRRKDNERPLPGRHVRIRFAQPVSGPVVLGSKKNFGLGLCVPTQSREEAP